MKTGRLFIPMVISVLPALLLPVPARSQGGINLSWDDCGSFGHELKSFACDTNDGTDVLYVSAATPVDVPLVEAAEVSIIFTFPNSVAVPPWWHLEISFGCRAGLIPQSDFTAAPHSCAGVWGALGPQAAGSMLWSESTLVPNQAFLRAITTIPGTTTVTAGTERIVMAFVFNHQKTVGAGSCAGCSSPACIQLDFVDLREAPGGDGHYFITNPLGRQTASWGCNTSVVAGGCSASCPVPALRNSWGTIKSLYR